METLAIKQHLSSQNPKRKLSKPETPFGPSSHLRAVRDWTRRGTTGRIYCTRAGPPGAPPPDDAGRKISRPTAAGRAGIRPANPTAAASIFHMSFVIFGHFPATSGHPIAPSTIFGPSELIYVVHFCRFRTVWKLHCKRNRPKLRSGFPATTATV